MKKIILFFCVLQYTMIAVAQERDACAMEVELGAGMGVGFAKIGNSAQIEYLGNGGYADNGPGGSVCFMPRIGIELWRYLRLTFSYVAEERANNHFSLTIGIALCGGRK